MRRYWGYDSFLPLQERIVQSILGGSDVAAVMPTGGGKSLCYQLPAVARGGTAVVVSPLIALMQDQAAQLEQMGIPAAALNSAQTPQEQGEVMRGAVDGAYRLLYLSPERLARNDTIAWLRRVPLTFFAIDEAHCISEWGHEFRPEYRQLSCLRENFPDCPIAAFTASATKRVRHDILEQLQLRDPHRYIRSFVRPNLRYAVRSTDMRTQRRLLLRAVRAYQGQSIIVYAPTIAMVEETAEELTRHGVPALPYHGKMETADRQLNQERWTSDEVRVLVGTIAFGMGINKSAVRAVIHLSLPKSIEQYYQESGRAGRDGLAADCVLLWRTQDTALLAHFIEEIGDDAERQRAWQRYHDVRRLVESAACRKRHLCVHFGEMPKWQRCGMCDRCGWQPEWLCDKAYDEVTLAKSKRKRERKRQRAEAPAVAPPREPAPVPVASQAAPAAGLPEFMRQWRRRVAQRQGVPAYVVMHDTTLEEICRRKPASLRELLQVPGMGEMKAERYGQAIFAALEAFARGERIIP